MYSNNILKCIYEIHVLSLILDYKAKQFLNMMNKDESEVISKIEEALVSIQKSGQYIVQKLNSHSDRLSHSVSAAKSSSVDKKNNR